MKWENGLDPATLDAITAKPNTTPVSAVPDGGFMSGRVSTIYGQNPWLKPETILSLARSNASDQAVEAAGYISGIQRAQEMPDQATIFGMPTVLKSVGKIFSGVSVAAGWVGKGLSLVAPDLIGTPMRAVGDLLYNTVQDLKPATRWGTAALDVIPELANFAVSKVLGSVGLPIEYGQEPEGGFWDSTSIGQMLAHPEDQGSGFFMSDVLREAQAREARARRGMINGSAFTTGRGVASLVFDTDSSMYRTFSGVIDAIQLIALPDPTKYVTKGMKLATVAMRGGLVPLVSDATVAATHIDDWLKVLQEVNPNTSPGTLVAIEAGIKGGLNGPAVDLQKFTTFMRSNPTAKRLVNSLIEEEDAGKIFSSVFRGRGTTDVAYNLSKAKTEDQVIASMLGAYTFGDTPISRNLGFFAPPVTVIKPLRALKELSKRSRLLARVPDEAVVISGDALDNTKAVNNFADSLRSAGVGKAEVDKFTTTAVNALRSGGSAVDKYAMDGLYNQLIEKSLTQNRIKKEAIDLLLEKDKASMTQMRSYFKDRLGNDTDAGFMQALMNVPVIKSSMAQNTWDDLLTRISTAGGGYGADLHFEGAIQHTDMMSRMRLLPDQRALRRLTRNPLLTRVLSAMPGGGTSIVGGETVRLAAIRKLPILSGREVVTVITDRLRWAEIDKEMGAIKKVAATAQRKLSGTEMSDIQKLSAEQAILMKPKKILTGNQRGLVTMVELLQNEVWKRMTLMTGGYYIRNMIDAQVRMAFADVGSVIRHPMEYISLVIGRSASKDILGTSMMARGSLGDETSEINQLVGDLRDRIASSTRIKGMGSADHATHLKGLGTFASVQRTIAKNGIVLHTEGVVQQLGKMNASPLSRVAARAILTSGGSRNMEVSKIITAIKSPNNTDIYADIKKLFMNGIEEGDKLGNVITFPPVDIDAMLRSGGSKEVDKLLEVYAEKIVLGNAITQTGGVDSMRFMAGYDAVPVMVNGSIERLAIKVDDLTDAMGGQLIAGNMEIGMDVVMKDGRKGIIIVAKKSEATVVPIVEKGSLTKFRTGTQNAQQLIKGTHLWDGTSGLPPSVTREITGSQKADRDLWAKMSDHMDRTSNWFFVSLNARSSRVLERSPVFRSLYYKTVLEHADELSHAEASTIVARLTGLAKTEGVSVEKFIGNSKLIPKLEAIIANPAHTGELGMKNLDQYAKALSLNEMESLLFDASNTNNLKDIMRIIVPFGNAWHEVVSHYLSNSMIDGVHKYRTFQRYYSGALNADPDQDGRGWFYKDPQTNELMFTFPMSSAISKIITGGDYAAGLAAPVKRLSQGINVYPGLGPFGQVIANKLIADTPKNDEVRALLMPYGSPKTLDSIMPGWMAKTKEAIEGDQTKTTGIYANTYFETIKAEANSGQYDLSLPVEVERLKENAASKAKWLTGMRALSQFVGPTSGQLEFKIPTNAGDVYVREIVKEFHDMQLEDYDSAVERFLNLHGENAALYVSSKSKSNQPGQETTDDFNDWTRNNEDLISAYARTANFLAPSFGDFDFKAQERQIESGAREALNADEMIALAQNRIGSSRYRAAKLALGAYPSKEQAARLAEFRVGLSNKYPGFKPKAEFVTNAHDNDLVELGKLIEDPRVAWNPAVPAIRQWLNMRNSILAASGMSSLKSKKLVTKRGDLFVAGEALAKSNPYFDRIWQRLLSQEVED